MSFYHVGLWGSSKVVRYFDKYFDPLSHVFDLIRDLSRQWNSVEFDIIAMKTKLYKS